MIRRFYVMPLIDGIDDERVDEMTASLSATDRYITGLTDSFAAVDLHSRTVVWEMTFRDEESYTGPYMVHPYHVATLDNYLLADSPEQLSRDYAAMRYTVRAGTPRLERGVRRVLLMNLGDGADVSALEAIADRGDGTALSVLATDDIRWKSSKGSRGLTWTHIWEQAFTDADALDVYLRTADGVASSSRDGLRRLGADVRSLQVLTYPFELHEAPPEPVLAPDDESFLYTITARLSARDVEEYVALLEGEYDVALGRVGAVLLHRWRTNEDAYREAEVQSTWRFDSMAAFVALRTAMPIDESWNRFVRSAMPLVRSGTRRFFRDRPSR